MNLTDDEIRRYDRHLKLSNFDLQNQLNLKQSRTLIVGAGGLGCPIALYLAASGVGTIAIADDDKVEISNLQRQIAFSTKDIGQNKATLLTRAIAKVNPLIKAIDYVKRIDASNVNELVREYDLVIDGSDNFATRFLLADACFLAKISYLHASVHEYQGQVCLFIADKSPCFRCLYRQPPGGAALPPCTEAGILGIVTGSVGLLAATEAIKYLSGLGSSIAGKVIIYNVLEQELKKFDLERDSNCPLCSQNASITQIQNEKLSKGSDQTQRDYAQCMERVESNEHMISIAQVAKLIKSSELNKDVFLLDVREEHEYMQEHLEDAVFLPLSLLQTLSTAEVTAQLNRRLPTKDSKKNKERTILCYCQRGARSLKAVGIFRQAGFAKAFSVEGGLDAWRQFEQSVHRRP